MQELYNNNFLQNSLDINITDLCIVLFYNANNNKKIVDIFFNISKEFKNKILFFIYDVNNTNINIKFRKRYLQNIPTIITYLNGSPFLKMDEIKNNIVRAEMDIIKYINTSINKYNEKYKNNDINNDIKICKFNMIGGAPSNTSKPFNKINMFSNIITKQKSITYDEDVGENYLDVYKFSNLKPYDTPWRL